MISLKTSLIFLTGEVILTGVFFFLNLFLNHKRQIFSIYSVLKGAFERIFLIFALLLGYENMLLVFGALKLGTRLEKDAARKISNDYFLIGNLLSIGAVLLYIYLFS